MNLPRSLFLLAWMACPLLGACAPNASVEPTVVTAESNGGTARLRQGGAIVVRLPSNGATGYTWVPAQIPKQLRLVSDDFRPPDRREEQPPVAGKAGSQEFRFVAGEAGSGTLVLVYRPAWDRSAEPDETFRLTAQVSGG